VSAALVKKELRDQRPFLALGLVLCCFDLAETLLDFPDTTTLGHSFHELTDFSSQLLLVLAFAVGTGLLVREQDEGTLRFLDGLPVTRLRLFATKLAVAVGVLLVYPAARTALAAVLHLLSRSSLNPELHPQLLLISLGLNALMVLQGLALGMLLGYLRTLAWATAATLGVVVMKLGDWVPRAKNLNPFHLLDVHLTGLRWDPPWEALAVQAGLAALTCLLVAAAYSGARGQRLWRLAQATRRPFWSAVVLVVTLGSVLWAIGVAGRDDQGKKPKHGEGEDDGEAMVEGAEFAPAPPVYIATRRYTFRYPGFRASVVKPLAEKADAAFDQVAGLLPPGGDKPIDVDMSGSRANTLGTAFHDRVRMTPTEEDGEEVLIHETAHVLASRMLDESGSTLLARLPLLNEGLAQWVAYRAPGGDARRERDAFEAAVIFSRHDVKLEELTDFDQFEKKQDKGLQYPLGAVLVEALAERYGDQAPRHLLETLAKPDFPNGPRGMLLYQALFQLAGYDLSVVTDLFFQKLEATAKARAKEIAALPRLRGAVEAGKTRVRIRVLTDKPLPEGESLLVRLRPTPDADLQDYRAWYARDDGSIELERDDIALDAVCFQPGLHHGKTVFYEPWQCQPVQWADDDSVLEESAEAPPVETP
jgi:hypothetical protein